MSFTTLTAVEDVVERWPYDFQRIDPPAGSGSLDTSGTFDVDSGTVDVESGSITHYKYLAAYAAEMRYVDEQINELYSQRFISSATGRELEKLGAPLGITRRAGESDESLRLRIAIGKPIASSNGTADDIESIIRIAFGEDALEDIQVGSVDSQPVTEFAIPQVYIDNIPLTRSEFRAELERAFPCGHGVQLITTDTFILGEDDEQGLGNGELI